MCDAMVRFARACVLSPIETAMRHVIDDLYLSTLDRHFVIRFAHAFHCIPALPTCATGTTPSLPGSSPRQPSATLTLLPRSQPHCRWPQFRSCLRPYLSRPILSSTSIIPNGGPLYPIFRLAHPVSKVTPQRCYLRSYLRGTPPPSPRDDKPSTSQPRTHRVRLSLDEVG